MHISGKSDDPTVEDLRTCGRNVDICDKRIKETIGDIVETVRNWTGYAEYIGVSEKTRSVLKVSINIRTDRG